MFEVRTLIPHISCNVFINSELSKHYQIQPFKSHLPTVKNTLLPSDPFSGSRITYLSHSF